MTDDESEPYELVSAGDEDAISAYLDAHPGILARPHDPWLDPLVAAVETRNVRIVELLLRHGASLEYVEHPFGDDPPLHRAAKVSEPEIVRALLAAGIPVDQQIVPGSPTPLWMACRGDDTDRYLDVVRVLLEHGADPNEIWLEGYTPLVYARGLCDDELEQVLLEFGAVERVEDPKLLAGHLPPMDAYVALAMGEPPGISLEELGSKLLDVIGHGEIDWRKVVLTKDGKAYAVLTRKLSFRESILHARDQLERWDQSNEGSPDPLPPELPWEEMGPAVLDAASQIGERWGGLDIDKNGQRYARLSQMPPDEVLKRWAELDESVLRDLEALDELNGPSEDPTTGE